MGGVKSVTVYCSSSPQVSAAFAEAARALGRGLAERGMGLVYGGGCVGLMGETARACRGSGGRVVGVITERLREAEQLDPDNDEVIVTATMRERKAILESRGDAFVVLPGGLGTMEEFFEVLVGRLLGEHGKPIVVANLDEPEVPGCFYDPLLAMIDHMIANRFAKPGIRGLFHVSRTVGDVLSWLEGIANGEVRVETGPRLDLVPSAGWVQGVGRS